MITVDTSALIALLDGKDPDHERVTEVLQADTGPLLVPAEILGEAGYFIETRFGNRVLDAFLGDLESGAYTVAFSVRRLPRIRALVERYGDLRLGLVDSAVIACAEEHGGRVLTLDLRDFMTVAAEGTISVLP